MKKRYFVMLPLLAALAVAGGWGSVHFFRAVTAATGTTISLPTTRVKRGDVTFTVAAQGRTAGRQLGDADRADDRRACDGRLRCCARAAKWSRRAKSWSQFDTTEQEFMLREAEADLAEAEQQMIQAQSESKAKEEEARYALMEARAELKIGGTGDAAQRAGGEPSWRGRTIWRWNRRATKCGNWSGT